MQKLYDDKLLIGQKTNRPALPEPEKDEAGGFSSLFFAQKNQSTLVDRTFAEMWEQHVARYMKGLQHANPGGWTYSHGWSDLIKDQTIINEADTTLREKAALEARVKKLETAAPRRTGWFNGGGQGGDGALPGLGGLQALFDDPAMVSGALSIAGGGLLVGGLLPLRRRRRPDEDAQARPHDDASREA